MKLMKLCEKGTSVVIKSTILPGVCHELQDENPDLFIFQSPEFLDEVTAKEDTDKPSKNIVGMKTVLEAGEVEEWTERARIILDVLPEAPHSEIVSWDEAAMIKYAHNCYFYIKNVF